MRAFHREIKTHHGGRVSSSDVGSCLLVAIVLLIQMGPFQDVASHCCHMFQRLIHGVTVERNAMQCATSGMPIPTLVRPLVVLLVTLQPNQKAAWDSH